MKIGLSIALVWAMALAGCTQNDTKREEQGASEAQTKVSELQTRKLAACPDFPEDKDAKDFTEALERPVKIPDALKDAVLASKTTLTIGHADGKASCLDISTLNVGSIDALANGRALGIALYGTEFNSYLVYDRLHKRDAIETGVAPSFAPSGQKFASIDASESAFGAFESFGAWEVESQNIVPIAVQENGGGFDITGTGADWKVTGWSKDENCVSLSAIDVSVSEGPETRKVFHVALDAKPLQLQPGACP